ncbi:hypothetical protein FACS1894107_17090 [Planctomycetales bacterium]|nr:hypothetical protein FACS1894107_17090 [Planctomycetales bacterium]GHS97456.1 hypothetical protein FACS1894108_03860 [Planctomycetales bacterium]
MRPDLNATAPYSAPTSELLWERALKNDADNQDEIRHLLRAANRAATRLRGLFPATLSVVFVGSLALWTAAIALLLRGLAPNLTGLPYYLCVGVPALLSAAAVAHQTGNFIIELLSGLKINARRGLALHLPANRSPREWSRYFRRWLYCGDWLVEGADFHLTPYVRVFITGASPAGVNEELALWDELMTHSRRAKPESAWEMGHSVCEMARLPQLPVWAKEITPGMSLRDLEISLGEVGRNWAIKLLKRAALRKNSFGKIDYAGQLREAIFEFHYCQLINAREALLVIIRPHRAEMTAALASAVSDAA